MPIGWRESMHRALYGPDGFFVSAGGPADHFRTSVHASPVFATALFRLLERIDAALGSPPVLDLVDVGAGRGELLRALVALAGLRGSGEPLPLARRLRVTAVELAPRPADLPPGVGWVAEVPAGITGLLLATEWLDNVPLDVAVPAEDGWRYVLVDPATGEEALGAGVSAADADWLARWWPPAPTQHSSIRSSASAGEPESDANLLIDRAGCRAGDRAGGQAGGRAEIGRTRDEAWARAVGQLDRGLAVAVDYGHLREDRPIGGTLTGYRGGRQVPAVPDGSCDVTAHVAFDSVAAAGTAVAGAAYTLVSQREALRALGADGGRPPLSLAATDPAGYVRALAAASAVAELTDPAGLGGHRWLLQPVGVVVDPLMAR
ncbi:SAM-dependent methyltransferase [Micromonospora olivasterospora]|uniref:SAM-dependent MidA family methyltransferase n=1 Tax=Micromonospora olivasterospora TaxID=1880 RepID=A0A562I816_MICOL|nr:SAM-dependent methyltransferase [Micromonospora olivasterospora]TWH66966.1 SAM-dependent MidA family methyltransferase [Micromonospora olivasterospora]